jgi:hypothetical protein
MTIFLLILAAIFLIAAFIFRFYVHQPTPEQKGLTEQIPVFTNLNPQSSPLAQGLSASKAHTYTESAKAHIEAAQAMTALHEQYEKAKALEATAPARLELELMNLQNQTEVAERAKALGVTPLDYSEVMRTVLKGKAERYFQKVEIDQTIEAGFDMADRRFKRAKQLRGQILDLRLELEATRQKQLPLAIQEAQIQDLQDSIRILQKELEENIGKAAVPEINGQESG